MEAYQKVVLGTFVVIALLLTSQIWTPGFLMNGDHGMHYSLMQCFKEGSQWLPTGAWCSVLPQWSYNYLFFPPLFYWLVLFFSFVLPLAIAYKLVVLLSWFFLPAVVCWFFLQNNKTVAALVSFALLLFLNVEVSVFGFDYVFLYGGIPQVLGWGFFILSYVFFTGLVKSPDFRACAKFVAACSLLVLSHAIIFVLFLILAVFIGFNHRKELVLCWKRVLFCFLLVFGLTAVWTVPFLFKSYFLQNLNALPEVGRSAPVVLVHGLQKLSPFVLVFGVFGWLWNFKKKERETVFVKALFWLFVVVFFLGFFPFAYSFASWFRLSQLLIILAVFGCSLFVEHIFAFQSGKNFAKPIKYCLVIAVALLFVLPQFIQASASSRLLLTSKDGRLGNSVESIYSLIAQVVGGGNRVFVEDFYYQSSIESRQAETKGLHDTTRFWIPFAVFSDNEVITGFDVIKEDAGTYALSVVGGYGQFVQQDFVISGKRISKEDFEVDNEKVKTMLESVGTNYVLSTSKKWDKIFGTLSVFWEAEDLKIFYHNSSSSIFAVNEGTILNEAYTGLSAEADLQSANETVLVFRNPVFPNWLAFVDNEKVSIGKNELGFMAVKVPAGRHKVSFKHALLWYEYLGLASSLISILIVIVLFFRRLR